MWPKNSELSQGKKSEHPVLKPVQTAPTNTKTFSNFI